MVLRTVDVEQARPVRAEVKVLQQAQAGVVRQHHRVVGMADVAGQGGAASGGIDPDDGRPGQGRAEEQEHVLRHVLQEDADVERPRRRSRRSPAAAWRLCSATCDQVQVVPSNTRPG